MGGGLELGDTSIYIYTHNTRVVHGYIVLPSDKRTASVMFKQSGVWGICILEL